MLNHVGQINRLKTFFHSGINYKSCSKMLENTARKFTGNIPDDLKAIVISKNNSQNHDVFLELQNVFEKTAAALKDINKAEKQAIYRMPHADGKRQKALEELLWDISDVSFLWKRDALYKDQETLSILKAEDILLNGLKKYLPDIKNIVITPLGIGQFALGYKCNFLGEKGKKLISDKVFKIYRDDMVMTTFAERNKRFTEVMPDEVLIKIEQQKADYMEKNFGCSYGYNRTPDQLRKIAVDTYNYWKDKQTKLKVEHGAFAEANIAEFLKYFSGHKLKPKDGIVIPYMFGLGDTKFCVSEYISKNMKAAKTFDFLRLGLNHNDFSGLTDKNNINGICYDLGGIVSLLKNIKWSGDKSTIKFVKDLVKVPPKERKTIIQALEKTKGESVFTDKFIKKINKS